MTLLYAGAVALAKAAPEQPLPKNALLIANAEYKGLGSLPNPIPDARLLSESLRKIGFEVVLLENGNREQMLDAVDAFQNRLKSSKGISLFHFGGHGIQMDGRNYMIPAHTEIPDDRKLSTRAVDLDEVMTSLDAAGSFANVVVLDACRDNPLTARSRSVSRGLAAVQTQPKNTLIVYAAESGKKAEDGLFTPVFARTLAVPGLSLSRLLQQVRSEVHKLSNGQQTPGAYDQTFDEVFLNDGGPSKLEIVIPSSPSPVEKTSPAMPAPLTVTPPSPQAQQTQPPSTRPLPSTPVPANILGNLFTNSLGQKFVPIPGPQIYFCVWSTRVMDYEKFAAKTGREWKNAGFAQKPDHPAVRVNYYDAVSFCAWLTKSEHATGLLPRTLMYRLPKDLEWSSAAGIVAQEITGPPAWRSGGLPRCYPWGSSWPPPKNFGNYDTRLKVDPFPFTSPVGYFAPNKFGLFDMSGNVYQWLQEDYDETGQGCLRGGSWPDESEDSINMSNRFPASKDSSFKCYGFRCVIASLQDR